MESVRIDRWLCAARVYKSRTQAADACAGGRVLVNGSPVKPSHLLRVGAEVRTQLERGLVILDVLGLSDRRLSAPAARELYLDRSPPRAPREPRVAPRVRGAGRPTKRERRDTDRLRGR